MRVCVCVCVDAYARVCVCMDAYTCMFLCAFGIHNAKHQVCNILLCILANVYHMTVT